jgi:hypothetical protein
MNEKEFISDQSGDIVSTPWQYIVFHTQSTLHKLYVHGTEICCLTTYLERHILIKSF